jgi:hypothetical protein
MFARQNDDHKVGNVMGALQPLSYEAIEIFVVRLLKSVLGPGVAIVAVSSILPIAADHGSPKLD